MTMTRTRIITLVVFAALAAAPALAQPIGPGPIGPGPIGPGPVIAGPMEPGVIGPGPRGIGPMIAAAEMRLIGPRAPSGADSDDRADELYERARELMEDGKYDRALVEFDRLIPLKSKWTDAALYWKAYTQAKLGQRAEALKTLTDFEAQYKESRWLKSAKALSVEVRQASGQTVSPSSQDDDEMKLYALRGLMNNDPEQALPILEKMLTAPNAPKVKDRVLFVLSQSHSAKAREVIAGVAKGNADPDLQMKAIRYIGQMGGTENRQILSDVYRGSNDTTVKRAILRSYMTAGDRERLFALAKGETDVTLRSEAVRQLGAMSARAELAQLYQTESSVDIKKQVLQAMFVGGDSDRLIELAKNERDPELRRTAIRNLGLMRRTGTGEALVSIYNSDSNPDVKKAVISALFTQNNAASLVTIARAEKNIELKKDIVSKLSNMKSKEATDYLMELLK